MFACVALVACSFEFRIGSNPREVPEASGEPEYGDIIMSHGVEGPTAAPVDDVTIFDPDDREIFAVLPVENLRAPFEFEARWYYGDEEIFNISSEVGQDLIDTHIYSNLKPQGRFPRGPHAVELFIDGEGVGRANFTIE
jgi:hypothetical protein